MAKEFFTKRFLLVSTITIVTAALISIIGQLTFNHALHLDSVIDSIQHIAKTLNLGVLPLGRSFDLPISNFGLQLHLNSMLESYQQTSHHLNALVRLWQSHPAFMIDCYKWITTFNIDEYLTALTGALAILGGFEALVKNWKKGDTENIVFLINIGLLLVCSRIAYAFAFQFTSFLLANFALGLIAYLTILYIKDCLDKSHYHAIRKIKKQARKKRLSELYCTFEIEESIPQGNKNSCKDLVELLEERYIKSMRIQGNAGYSERLYTAVRKDLKRLTKDLDDEQKILFAKHLVKHISDSKNRKDSKDVIDYNETFEEHSRLRWYLAAIIKWTYNMVREHESCINEFYSIFKPLNATDPAPHFCKFILVSAIEMDYCVNTMPKMPPLPDECKKLIAFGEDLVSHYLNDDIDDGKSIFTLETLWLEDEFKWYEGIDTQASRIIALNRFLSSSLSYSAYQQTRLEYI